jgi:multidrug transporter EmrE-like cation transporter
MSGAWLALAAAISSSLVGQVLLKSGAEGMSGGSLMAQLLRPTTVLGFGFYGIGALLYIVALRRIPMSVALPCTAASYIVIALIGWWFFGEVLGAQKLAAITLIGAGVIMLAVS